MKELNGKCRLGIVEMDGGEFQPTDLALTLRDIASRLQPSGGTYLEAGANDGLSSSNTYLLECDGWSGVLVEPSPSSFAKLRKNRPNNVLISAALVSAASQDTIQGTFAHGSLKGSADPDYRFRDASPSHLRGVGFVRRLLRLKPAIDVISVPARTLSQVWESTQLEQLTLLVLDVEGLELEVLRGLGDELRPRLVVVETRDRDALAIAETLLAYGYILAGNLSRFSAETHPGWSGDHQDLIWCAPSDRKALEVIGSVLSGH